MIENVIGKQGGKYNKGDLTAALWDLVACFKPPTKKTVYKFTGCHCPPSAVHDNDSIKIVFPDDVDPAIFVDAVNECFEAGNTTILQWGKHCFELEAPLAEIGDGCYTAPGCSKTCSTTAFDRMCLLCTEPPKKPCEVDLGPIEAKLQSICTSLGLICDKKTDTFKKLESICELLEKLCAKDEALQAKLVELCDQIADLCTKLEGIAATLDTIAEALLKVVLQLEEVCKKLLELPEILSDIKECITETNERLDKLMTDCEFCENKGTLTTAQREYRITSITIGDVDVSSKLGLPIAGNNQPILAAFKDDLVACLEDMGYVVTEQQGRDGWTLSYDGPELCMTRSVGSPPGPFALAKDNWCTGEAVVECALRTHEKNSDAILAAVQNLCAKQDALMVDCEFCSTIQIDPNDVIDNAVETAFDNTGLPQAVSPPATGGLELALWLSMNGYTVQSATNSSVTVCGAKLLSAVQLADDTIVPAGDVVARKGMLVCDPSTRALLQEQQTTNSILSEMSACLRAMKDCPEDACAVEPTVALTGETNTTFPFGDAGPNQSFPAPATNDSDIETFSFVLQAPVDECAKGSARLKLYFDHETDGGVYGGTGGGHNGVILSNGGIGAFVTGSGTNGATVTSATVANIKQAGSSPWTLNRAVRCIEYDVPVADLRTGVPITAGAWGSVSSGGEIMHDIRVELVDTADLDCSECDTGEPDDTKKPEGATYSTVNNTTDFAWSYNDTTLKLDNTQTPFSSPDAAPMLEAIKKCLAAGCAAVLDLTDPDGNTGQFTVTGLINEDSSAQSYSGTGDLALTQSGKVRTMILACQEI
jgi:hypothetical protein